MASIYLLMLKGAANPSSPLSLEVNKLSEAMGKTFPTTVLKRDLLFQYTQVTRNKYLRRLAETLNIQIC